MYVNIIILFIEHSHRCNDVDMMFFSLWVTDQNICWIGDHPVIICKQVSLLIDGIIKQKLLQWTEQKVKVQRIKKRTYLCNTNIHNTQTIVCMSYIKFVCHTYYYCQFTTTRQNFVFSNYKKLCGLLFRTTLYKKSKYWTRLEQRYIVNIFTPITPTLHERYNAQTNRRHYVANSRPHCVVW